MKKFMLACSLFSFLAAGLIVSPSAQAAEDNPNIVHRQSIYKIASGHMGALQAQLLLGGSGDPVFHAEGIKAAFEKMGKAYPEGSDVGETRAKPEIWENMEDFQQKGKEAYGAVLGLIEATKGGDKDQMVEAFKKVGGACKACHKEYREK